MADVTERDKEMAAAILKKNGLPTRFTDRETATRNRMLQDDIAAALANARVATPDSPKPSRVHASYCGLKADHDGDCVAVVTRMLGV